MRKHFKVLLTGTFLFVLTAFLHANAEQPLAKNQYEILLKEILSGEPFLPKPYSRNRALEIFFSDHRSDVLDEIKEMNSLNPAHQFPFANDDEGIGDISQVNFGFCSGFVGVTRDINLLGVFDPQGLRESLPHASVGSEEWIQFYRDKLERIHQGEVVVIPGFQDLNDLLRYPQFVRTVKEQIAWEWAKKALQLASMETFVNFNNADRAYAENFKSQLMQVLEHGIKPKIWFKAKISSQHSKDISFFDELTFIHVLQVFEVNDSSDGGFDLKLWDVNAVTTEPIQTLHIYPNGTGYYERWKQYISNGKVANYGIEPGEEWEWSKYVLAWEKYKSNTFKDQVVTCDEETTQ